MTLLLSSSVCNLGVTESEILDNWNTFCLLTQTIINNNNNDDASMTSSSNFQSCVSSLCKYGDGSLRSLVEDHFLSSLQVLLKKHVAPNFWKNFDAYSNVPDVKDAQEEYEVEMLLCKALEEMSREKQYQEKCLSMLVHSLNLCQDNNNASTEDVDKVLFSKYRQIVSSVLMTTLPHKFNELLQRYFKRRLEKLSTIIAGDDEDNYNHMKTLENKLSRNIGTVVKNLVNLGFTSMTENAYASAIFLLLKAKVYDLAGDEYRNSVLESIKEWIQAVPLRFLHELNDSLSYLRLEYFAYETLQDLRIAKLFEIIVDYPDSVPAINDLKQCLEHTGQHSKLVDSYILSLQYRLLTTGASTNDILDQYVSTVKVLRIIDPTGVLLEAVGEPIREYLRGRNDTIKCIVTMLNGPGNALLEEINRDEENQENEISTDDKQAWIDIQRWEPDPSEAGPLNGSRYRRKVDVLGTIFSIIGSKNQLIKEYRVMLAEKLLNKTDYDIDTEIRTLELLKIHFGESSMQKCEIMLNDLIDSKRINTNVKNSINELSKTGAESREHEVSFDILDATIISSNFWPPIQDYDFNIPEPMDQLLGDYAKRFHEIKTPRKLLWKKNLGTVKLELEFEDRTLQFTVTPVHTTIIMKFQEQTSWTSKSLAAAIGLPVDTLQRSVNFWISKGIVAESCSGGNSNDYLYTLVDSIADGCKTADDDDAERSVASDEDQVRKEIVYEKFITGMLQNGGKALDRIHYGLQTLFPDPAYDKSLQQLQSFLSGLAAEEKIELRDDGGNGKFSTQSCSSSDGFKSFRMQYRLVPPFCLDSYMFRSFFDR